MVGVVGVEVELGEDVVDVLGDRCIADDERSGDRGVLGFRHGCRRLVCGYLVRCGAG